MTAAFENVLAILRNFTKDELTSIFNIAMATEQLDNNAERCQCPWCSGSNVIRYGKKLGKQRFQCKDCKKTFVTTTKTIMSMSHQPRFVWNGMIEDTIKGYALSYSEKRLDISHQTAFNMRHKILLSMQETADKNPTILQDVSELDETFVLECYKGKHLPAALNRPARKHGAVAMKRGISSEYVCICTGVQRKNDVFLQAVNRAKPSSEEIVKVFKDHIGKGALLLTDGLRSYNILETIADCSIKNITGEKTSFYNLNTVNRLHSFIKSRYNDYRGVATKYINRYCSMFQYSYRCNDSALNRLKNTLLHPGSGIYHSIADVKQFNLATI